MKNTQQNEESYRASHATPGYGQIYSETYEEGYYADQWVWLERPLLRQLVQKMVSDGRTKVLDFACGTGRITKVLEEEAPDVTGVDISGAMLEVARSHCNQTTFVHRDITSENLEERFDVVTSFRFFLNAEDALRNDALRSIREVLKDDGRLLANIHVNSTSIMGLAYRLRNKIRGKVIAKSCSLNEIKQALSNQGFDIESLYWYSYWPRMGWRMQWANRLFMRPMESVLKRIPGLNRWLAQSFIFVARKV